MSTFKKVISLVLCAAILAGSFVLAGDLAAPVASASEETQVGATRTVKKSTDANGAETSEKSTGILSYADLVATYGTATGADGLTDGFLYVGTEYYEADGRLTDGYIKPGDKLTVKVYVKSNMYTGDGYIISLYDNSIWDVKVVADGASLDANGYTSNFTGKSNSAHPATTTNGYTTKVTSINITNAGWIKNTCGFDTDYLAATDLVQTQTSTNTSVSSLPYQFTSDEWLMTYYVTLKSELPEGTTEVSVKSPDVIWQSYLNGAKHDARKRAYVPVAHITATGINSTSNCKTMCSQLDSGALDYFIKELEHTFIIGEPAEAVEYNVDFYENDGTTKIGETASFEEGEAATFPAAAENQIAWAVIKEGLTTPGTLIEPDAEGNYSYTVKAADAAFMRVLADDKYNVELALGTDSSVDESKLPEGVTYDAAKNALVIALPVGGTFDLSTIPEEALSKKDHTFDEWDVTGVTGESSVEGTVITLGNVNGKGGTTVTAKIAAKWETATYNIRFFLNKEAYDNGDDPVVETTILAGGEYTCNVETFIKDMKFAGWYTADTNELASTAPKIKQYSYSRDMDFYAEWSEYANSASFVIRDYEAGEGWKEVYFDCGDGETKTITYTNLTTIKNNAVNAIGATFTFLLDVDPDTIAADDSVANHIVKRTDGEGKFPSSGGDLVYSGHNVYYLVTTMDYSVTWNIPVYDSEAGAFAEGEYTAYPQTASTAYTPSNGIDPYFATAKFSTDSITHPTGWEITGWVDAATGEPVEFNEEGAIVLSGLETKEVALNAVYSLIKYPVSFNLKNGASPDIVTMVGTVSLGDSIVIDGAEFEFNGEASALPEIGVENSEQPDGGYTLPAGNVFAGWTYMDNGTVVDAEFPVTLTESIIKSNLVRGTIRFGAEWDAKEFKLSFYIVNAEGEEELYSEQNVKVGDNIAAYKELTDEAKAAINAKAPKGKVFSNVWVNKETGTTDTNTKMPAKDVAYVASYVTATITVYVDYNHLATPDISQSMKEFKVAPLLYGQDITEVKSEAPYSERSFKTVVERTLITTTPEDPSEIIAWNIYHVDAGADPYTAEWKSGVNDAGTNIATTTLIFQPVWKAHKDFFIRAHDTDDKIYLGLGKDFKLYYWNNGAIVDKFSDTKANVDPENNIVLFYTIEADWSNFSFRFDAFPIPKYIFTLEGMLGIFEMLGNLLGSLL